MITLDDLKKLGAPFDEKTLGVKVQSLSKDKTKAMLVCYVQHTDVYARLESVDPAWSMEVTSSQRIGDSYFVRVKLTVKGVARENSGDGEDEKSATSDAIKRAAMLFGVGRYLYDSETVWVPYNEQTDKFRTWTVQDYQGALRRGQAPLPMPAKEALDPPRPTPAPAAKATPTPEAPKPLNKAQLGAEIFAVAKQIGLDRAGIVEWVDDLYKTKVDKMTEQQMRGFLEVLQREVGRKGA